MCADLKSRSFEYQALRVVQQSCAEPFYLTVAPAREILEWADVPRKKSGAEAGYQRELTDRWKKVRSFLTLDPANVVPTAVLLTVETPALKVTHRDGYYTLSISRRQRTQSEQLALAIRQVKRRLSQKAPKTPRGSKEEEPPSYLETLLEELTNFETLNEKKRAALEDYVSSFAKPGLIIDGQHRVFGAVNIPGKTIKLPAVLMPGLSQAEQAFQFYVVNNTARPLSKTQLRNVISTSLTDAEIHALYKRLDQLNVQPGPQKWPFKADVTKASPFYGIVARVPPREAEDVVREGSISAVMRAFMMVDRRLSVLTD